MKQETLVVLSSKELRKLRKVKAPLHRLSPQKKKILRESSIGDFFDVRFLKRVGLGRSEYSLEQSGKNIEQLLTLLGYKTVGDIERGCNPYYFAELHGVGNSAVALLLDLMLAFDLTFKKTKVMRVSLPVTHGDVLAEKLGL